MAARLSQAEHDWFVRHAVEPVTPTTPLNQIKAGYFHSVLTGENSNLLNELEDLWVSKMVSDLGGTPTSYDQDNWRQIVTLMGYRPSKFLNENKLTFYLNAP